MATKVHGSASAFLHLKLILRENQARIAPGAIFFWAPTLKLIFDLCMVAVAFNFNLLRRRISYTNYSVYFIYRPSSYRRLDGFSSSKLGFLILLAHPYTEKTKGLITDCSKKSNRSVEERTDRLETVHRNFKINRGKETLSKPGGNNFFRGGRIFFTKIVNFVKF